ncbi:MAG: methyltransferase domain-containing protein [Acidobacteria bacterium]|nr:methyltransferase domain-containing protein [Acidobacteriota bacterium]
MRMNHFTAFALLTTAACVNLAGQVAEKANEGYKTKEDRERVAVNLGDPDRVERQKPVELLEAIGVTPGQTIGDIGTGVGFMLPYMADAIGPSGRVYAEDIQDDFLEKAQAVAAEHGLKNISFVKGDPNDVKLPENSLDLALILDVYHHINYPEATMASVYKALKPGGRLAVIDFYRSREHPSMSEERLKNHIRLDRDGFKAEIEAGGFNFDRTFDHLPYQYVLMFRK